MKTEPEVRTLGAGKFKATCLQLMDEVLEKNLTIIVTKRGKAVAQLSAPTKPEAAPSPTPSPAAKEAPVAKKAPATKDQKHSKKRDKGKKKKHK